MANTSSVPLDHALGYRYGTWNIQDDDDDEQPEPELEEEQKHIASIAATPSILVDTDSKPLILEQKEQSRQKMKAILKQYPFKQSCVHDHKKLKIKQELILEAFLDAYPFCDAINERYIHDASCLGVVTDGIESINTPTPLQYFISAMQTTFTKSKHEDIWECIKLLLLKVVVYLNF
eukprot:419699_1